MKIAKNEILKYFIQNLTFAREEEKMRTSNEEVKIYLKNIGISVETFWPQINIFIHSSCFNNLHILTKAFTVIDLTVSSIKKSARNLHILTKALTVNFYSN